MKFLKKTTDSTILQKNLVYQSNNSELNRRIREILLEEQKNFCAYTEKYVEELDSCEVEHFNSSIKYEDDYFNYYAVIRKANQYKKDNKYKDSSFFESLFFQDEVELNNRICYLKGGIYTEIDESDQEAKEFIDFLGFNHPELYKQRKRSIERIKHNFQEAGYDREQIIEYFREFPVELTFISALEIELDLDLSEFYSHK